MQLAEIQKKIHVIRDQKIIMDFDLAMLYGTETKNLKRAVRRNMDRFPIDFMFQISRVEWDSLRSQFGALEKGRGEHTKYLPYAFMELGVAMISSILNSKKAITINIEIMRAFVFLRKYVLSHDELTKKLAELENKFDKKFEDVFEAIEFLSSKDKPDPAQKKRKKIGFKSY